MRFNSVQAVRISTALLRPWFFLTTFALPYGRVSPGSVFVGQDVDDLLDELCGCHVVAVLGCADQVVTHFLLISFLCCILSTVGLEKGGKIKALHMLQVMVLQSYA